MGVGAAIAGVGVVTNLIGASQASNARRSAGRSAQAAAEFDAQIAEKNAANALDDSLDQRNRFMTQFRLSEGTNRANIGRSGITAQGSVTDVLSINAANAARDAAAITHQGELKRQAFLDDAASLRRGGRAAAAASRASATAELLGGVGGALTGIGSIASSFGGGGSSSIGGSGSTVTTGGSLFSRAGRTA